ncbi:putative nitrogen permease regulator family [Phaeomoniella chlamydospora]|uniref:Putative nitrogen permease regulator family n=1 Tax=Phaeomoniella chlamydospora TaxID=158046 RepID=A0A0G2EKT8_PHACM|nr:putative nitrogen permease regulator family [Phaeomoniella chlamydospora]
MRIGPKIIHQVPSDAISGSHAPVEPSNPDSNTLFNFSDISFFVIPRQELCGNLITVCKDGYRIMGYPMCVKSSHYARNEFIFNFCFVLSEDEEFSPFKSVVQKMANLMRGLEEQSHFLSSDTSKPGKGKIYSLCEMLMEDLNNYAECMIPIDDVNTINMKLFPTYAPPPPVKAWHVPIMTVRPETLTDDNWDLTMQRIMPHINGISCVKQIAILADADLRLTRKCIKHLIYYSCVLLLDIFSFSAIYAPSTQFSSTIAADTDMQRECAIYINTAFAPSSNPTSGISDLPLTSSPSSSLRDPSVLLTISSNADPALDIFPVTATGLVVDGVAIVELYAALSQGLSVKQWYAEHASALANIDLRRFITFGVIKGFLYRVHKYAYLSGSASTRTNNAGISNGHGVPHSHNPAANENQPHSSVIPMQSQESIHSQATPPGLSVNGVASGHDGDSQTGLNDLSDPEFTDQDLIPYLDGSHPFDQICTEMEIGEASLVNRLRTWSSRNPGQEISIIHR